jgi:hypothetical protein
MQHPATSVHELRPIRLQGDRIWVLTCDFDLHLGFSMDSRSARDANFSLKDKHSCGKDTGRRLRNGCVYWFDFKKQDNQIA